MTRTKRGNSKFPPKFMKVMKKKKRRKIRYTPINKIIVEQEHNDASWQL